MILKSRKKLPLLQTLVKHEESCSHSDRYTREYLQIQVLTMVVAQECTNDTVANQRREADQPRHASDPCTNLTDTAGYLCNDRGS